MEINLKSVLLSIVLVLACFLPTQCSEPDSLSGIICYNIPENIIDEIDNFLDSDSNDSINKHYYCFMSQYSDTVTVTIVSYIRKPSSQLQTQLKLTNRYLVVSGRLLPIIFRSDFLFSDALNVKITLNGHLPAISSVTMARGSYYIRFRSSIGGLSGKILDQGYIY